MLHKLKTVQPFFDDIERGVKRFEHRRNDRGFKVGDEVCLQEYDMLHNHFSGKEVFGKITYVLNNRAGLDEAFCIFAFEVIEQYDENEVEEPEYTCDFCGGEDGGHELGCPDDESPFGLLIKEGYD